MKTKVTRIDPTLPLPRFATAGACGFDLYTRVTTTILPGTIAYLPSNLIIQTPRGHVLILTPRSSLAREKGLEMPNSIGVIDEDFCGPKDEILIQLRNVTDSPVKVKKGDRLAQGIFLGINRPLWEEITLEDNVKLTSRGGFGSTGGYEKGKDRKNKDE